jgi:hypothetical protein
MSNKIKIVMELDYDLEDFRFMVGEDFPEEQFRERVLEYAEIDIHTYLRDFALDEWCEVIEND